MSETGDWAKRLLGSVLLAVGVLIAGTGGLCAGLLLLMGPAAGGSVVAVGIALVGVMLIVAGRKLGGRTAAEMDAGLSFGQIVLRRLGVAFATWLVFQLVLGGFAFVRGVGRASFGVLAALGGGNLLVLLVLVGFALWFARRSR